MNEVLDNANPPRSERPRLSPGSQKSGKDAVADFKQAGILTYEQRLTNDPRWALSEGSRHFEENSAVFEALHKICQRLKEMGVSYAVVGGMALFLHGLRRFTEDVDILVSKEDLKSIHQHLDGLGYLPPHRHSKNLRDTQLGVRIEFLTTGDFPGDGKEKPVAFPDPNAVKIDRDGVSYINLPSLIELKLASGMTSPGRLKDLSDVLELIKTLNLPADFARQLNPYVRDKFHELWKEARRRFVAIWRNPQLTADELDEMRKDGVILEDREDGSVRLVTTNPDIAQKYDLVDEFEYWDQNDDRESV